MIIEIGMVESVCMVDAMQSFFDELLRKEKLVLKQLNNQGNDEAVCKEELRLLRLKITGCKAIFKQLNNQKIVNAWLEN